MIFDIAKFNAFNRSEGAKVWDIGNNVLYQLCREYPKHKKIIEVVAKLWLIGRSYAAAIERRKNKAESNDRFYVKAAKIIIDSDIDNQIQKIPKGNKLIPSNILTICNAHAYLTELFYKITQSYKSSLASKYLHFHRPLVPILDSRSRRGIGHIFKSDKSYNQLFEKLRRKGNKTIDKKFNDYLFFVVRTYYLQEYCNATT